MGSVDPRFAHSRELQVLVRSARSEPRRLKPGKRHGAGRVTRAMSVNAPTWLAGNDPTPDQNRAFSTAVWAMDLPGTGDDDGAIC